MKRKLSAGFTLTEALMVMAIIVVLAAAAAPSCAGAMKNVRQMSLNSKAETIYMAAQRNLVAAKVSGKSLSETSVNSNGKGTGDTEIILPANTISPALYNGNWNITYDAGHWSITQVYYSEEIGVDDLASSATSGKVGCYPPVES